MSVIFGRVGEQGAKLVKWWVAVTSCHQCFQINPVKSRSLVNKQSFFWMTPLVFLWPIREVASLCYHYDYLLSIGRLLQPPRVVRPNLPPLYREHQPTKPSAEPSRGGPNRAGLQDNNDQENTQQLFQLIKCPSEHLCSEQSSSPNTRLVWCLDKDVLDISWPQLPVEHGLVTSPQLVQPFQG